MLPRAVRTAMMLCALTAATGCAGSVSFTQADFADTPVPTRHQISGLPYIEQEQYFCGPAALASLLHYHHMPESQEQLAEQVFSTTKEGTFQHDMLYALRSRGLLAAPVNNIRDIIVEVAHGNPVLVLQNLGLSWVPQWHYAVITGYSLNSNQFFLHGGKARRDLMPFSTFAHTWRRADYWGYAVTQPPRLPVTTDTHTLDDLAPRFEELHLPLTAEQTYKALAQRPPVRSQPWFGLGNVYLAQGRFADAEGAYRRGLEIEPENPYIANNLAYALDGTHQREAACALLRQTLERPHAPDAVAMLEDSYGELCHTPATPLSSPQ